MMPSVYVVGGGALVKHRGLSQTEAHAFCHSVITQL